MLFRINLIVWKHRKWMLTIISIGIQYTYWKYTIQIYSMHIEIEKIISKCVLIFIQNSLKITLIRNFVNSTFCLSTFCLSACFQVDILSVRHFVHSTFCLFDILSVRHFVCRHFVCSTFCPSTLCLSTFCLSTFCHTTIQSRMFQQ